ncbi:putative low-complexity protein [Leptolyngbya sp. PCC 7375]|nr:putative low-complexity protein [Leptolyngbya sp. PCC 7375]
MVKASRPVKNLTNAFSSVWCRCVVILGITTFLGVAIAKNWFRNNSWLDLSQNFWGISFKDWLELMVAPTVFAIAGFLIRQLLEKQEEERRQLEERREDERRKHDALKDYLDDITVLFLSDNWAKAIQEKLEKREDKSLSNKTDNQKVLAIAKARTLAALNELDKGRQVQLIQFLSESRELFNFTFPGRGIKLQDADLYGACLSGADLWKANLDSAILMYANLDSVCLSEANLQNASLAQANLQNASLAGANLQNTILTGANLQNASLVEANLQNAILTGANLRNARLTVANLQNTNFERAHLNNTELADANLEGSNLIGANLEGTSLWQTNLKGTKLSCANLNGSDLSFANLDGADLAEIDSNDETKWRNAKGLDTAINIPASLKPRLINLGVLSPENTTEAQDK